jgi:hypothetical protein
MRYYRVADSTEKEISAHRSRYDPIKLSVKGVPFTCTCGGDTFHRPLANVYVFKCNRCGAGYKEEE